MRGLLLTFSIFTLVVSCGFDEEPKLPSVEERAAEAIDDLQDELVRPSNGWRLDYQPTTGTGTFLIILDFNTDGTVRVLSDLEANDGEFFDQTLSYRIDNAQGLELIFEIYGVFHYLFELEQASFGGEFEFIFQEEVGNNLIFSSKTDGVNPTIIQLVPASTTDISSLSTEATSVLNQGIFQSENLGNVGSFGTFNIYLEDNDHTLSITFDLTRRNLKVLGIAQGQTMDEIFANANGSAINQQSRFNVANEQIVLANPIQVNFGGVSYTISEIPIENFAESAESFCEGQDVTVSNFSSTGGSSLGNISGTSSLYQTHNAFTADDNFFSVNSFFIYDEQDNSIFQQLEAELPGVAAFQWYHGTEIADSTFNGLGFVTVDEFNNVEFYLRGLDFVQNGNFIEITFDGGDLITDTDVTQEQIDGLYALTDLIFSGGEVYVMELTNLGGLLEFYNPCNQYKGFLQL